MKKQTPFSYQSPIQDLFQNLYISLKETSLHFTTIFSVIAYFFDELHHLGIDFLISCFSQYSNDINHFAQERGLKRMQQEKDSSFKERVINAYHFMSSSSTLSGLENILTNASKDINPSATEPIFTIKELYKEHWYLGKDKLGEQTIISVPSSSLYFIIHFKDTPLTLDKHNYLSEITNFYKPAHIGFHISAKIQDDWVLGLDKEKLGINTYLTN